VYKGKKGIETARRLISLLGTSMGTGRYNLYLILYPPIYVDSFNIESDTGLINLIQRNTDFIEFT
jgi:hypothetical protein